MGAGLLQPLHLLIILVIVVLILGPNRLMGVGRTLGQSWRELVSGFRTGARDTPLPPALPSRPCPRCGVWSADLASFCTRCGTSLG